ncbi:MAG: WD40 repeat domain-containing protein [Planctomycetaceae bacterium]
MTVGKHLKLLMISSLMLLSVCGPKVAAQPPVQSASPYAPNELWLQQWGVTDLLDYDPEQGHLLGRYPDSVILWDVKTGLALRQYHLAEPGPLQVIDAKLLGHNRLLIGGQHSMVVLDRKTGRTLQEFDWPEVHLHALALNPEQPLVATATSDAKIRVWDLVSAELQTTIEVEHPQNSLAFSPDGRRLLSGDYSNVVRLWDAGTGKQLGQVEPPTEGRLLRFSDDGRKFLTAGQGEFWYTPRVTVWNAESLTDLQIIPRVVRDVWFAGDEVRLLTFDGEIELWPLDRHEEPAPPEEWSRGSNRSVRPSGVTGNHWVFRRSENPGQWEVIGPRSNRPDQFMPVESTWSNPDDHFPLAISPDGHWLLTGGASHGNRPNRSAIWNLQEGRVQTEFENAMLGEFHPEGRELVVVRNASLEVMDATTGKTIRPLEYDRSKLGPVTTIQFVKEGKQLLTAHGDWYDGDEGGILLWDYAKGKLIREYDTNRKAVLVAHYFESHNGHILAACSPGDDGSADIDQLTVFDAATGKQLQNQTFARNGLGVGPVSLSASLLSVSVATRKDRLQPRTVRRSLVSTFDLKPQVDLPRDSRPETFSYDGQVVFGLGEKRQLTLFDVKDADQLHSFECPFRPIRNIMPHPGGQLLCGALDDPWNSHGLGTNAVGFQDLLTGELDAQLFLFQDPDSWLIVTQDGAINGSEAGLKHVTWRRPGTLDVIRDEQRTQAAVSPERVAAILSRSLPANISLRERLTSLKSQ